MGNATAPVSPQGIGSVGDILAKRQQMVQQQQMRDKLKMTGSTGNPVGGYIGSPKISDQVSAPPQSQFATSFNQSQQAMPQQGYGQQSAPLMPPPVDDATNMVGIEPWLQNPRGGGGQGFMPGQQFGQYLQNLRQAMPQQGIGQQVRQLQQGMSPQSQFANMMQQFSGFSPFPAFGSQGSPNYGPFNGGQLPAQRPANLAPGMQFMDGGQPKPQAPSGQVPQGAGTTLRRFTNQQPANSFSQRRTI